MPDTTIPHRAVWKGRTASAVVVAALLVDGAMQLFAPAKIASMMQETGFAMDLTEVVHERPRLVFEGPCTPRPSCPPPLRTACHLAQFS